MMSFRLFRAARLVRVDAVKVLKMISSSGQNVHMRSEDGVFNKPLDIE